MDIYEHLVDIEDTNDSSHVVALWTRLEHYGLLFRPDNPYHRQILSEQNQTEPMLILGHTGKRLPRCIIMKSGIRIDRINSLSNQQSLKNTTVYVLH